MKRLMIKSVLALAAVAAMGMASAQERTLKMGLNGPEGHPAVAGMKKFAETVAAKSGGKIKVNLFVGGALGSDQANVSALQGGTLEMVAMNSGILASQVKDFGVFDFPFMFADGKEADAVVDGPFGKKMHAKLLDKGIVGLGYYELGFRHLSNGRRPINKAGTKGEGESAPEALRAAWAKKTTNPLLIFENYPFTDRGWYLPSFAAHSLVDTVNATKGTSKGEDIWLSVRQDFDKVGIGFNHFLVYFTARAYWGGQDVSADAMLREYCHLFYGPAEQEMLAQYTPFKNNS